MSLFVYKGLISADLRRWAPVFILSGLIASITGFHMTFTWPLPSSFNMAFGELSIMFGLIFLAGGLAMAKNWDLMPVTIYAFFAGAAAVVIGIRIIALGMTQNPILSGIGFITTGSGGIFAFLAWHYRHSKFLRTSGAFVMAVSALIWAFTGYMAYWKHMASLSEWVPK